MAFLQGPVEELVREMTVPVGAKIQPTLTKTRLIEFGPRAARLRAARGEGKPETFSFLEFTHICVTSRGRRFWIRRITDAKRGRDHTRQTTPNASYTSRMPVRPVFRWTGPLGLPRSGGDRMTAWPSFTRPRQAPRPR